MSSSLFTILEKALAGADIPAEECYRLIRCEDQELDALFAAASLLRDRSKGRIVTYSRKVFLPITNLCRDRCSYCTFRKDPNDPDAWTMTPDEINHWLERGRVWGCKEALMCLGDRPETANPSYRALLSSLGHATTADYVYSACEMALSHGILPHTNAGVLRFEEMKQLKRVNASLGLMLESMSPRLQEKGMPHFSAPDKDPALRVRMLCESGKLEIPFTTGILIGIGETPEERVDSLIAIRDVHRAFGHIQEVIVQNFRAKPDTRMQHAPEPNAMQVARTVATARLILGGEMNVQTPPNLNPANHAALLRAGINDWGGISPITKDYVNPEAAWPHIDALARLCRDEGFELRERLAIYPEFIDRPEFLVPALRSRTEELAAQVQRGS